MTFLTSFQVVHYRGIDGLSLPALTPANLVTAARGDVALYRTPQSDVVVERERSTVR